MQTNTIQIRKWRYPEVITIVSGGMFLTSLSQLSIPLPGTPVPLTLQTLGVFLLGGILGGRMAAASVLLYLLEASLGLPVLAGWKTNSLWLLSPNAGFLLSFIPAAMLIGKLYSSQSIGKNLLSLSLGQIVISTTGMLWLSFYVGSLKTAFLFGVLPFLLGAWIKIVAGTLIFKSYQMIETLNSQEPFRKAVFKEIATVLKLR